MILLPTITEAAGMFPDPVIIRQVIGFRESELSLLRSLLQNAEDVIRLKMAAESTRNQTPVIIQSIPDAR